MKRLALICLLVCAASAACNKPSEESCKKAIENMRKLMGTASYTEDIDPYVRRCRGGSSKEAVECATNAKTREELLACKFVHFDDKAPAPSMDSGSAPPAGSGSGSAK